MAHLHQFLLEKTEKKLRASASAGTRVRAMVGSRCHFFQISLFEFLSLFSCTVVFE